MTDRQPTMPDDRPALLRQQAVLASFGQFALQSEDLDAILHEACRLVGDALGTDLAKVMELQADGDTLLVRAGVGWKPGIVGVVRLQANGDSCESFALRTGEAVISPDIETETRFRYPDFLRDNGVRAVVNVPILGGKGQASFGLLQVDSREPRRFNDNDISFLRGYANLLAGAVGRLRGLGELRDRSEELERRVADRTRELTVANRRLEEEAVERELTHAALSQASKMEAVFEHLPIGAGLVGPNGQVIFANPEFVRLLPQLSILAPDSGAGHPWLATDEDTARIGPPDYPARVALLGELVLDLEFLDRAEAEGGQWRRVSGIPVRSEDGKVVAALMVIVDIDAEKRARQREALLTREVDHRAKNMLAVVQAALRLTRAEDLPSFVRAIEGRVMALARAQTLLAAEHWSGADLGTLLRGEMRMFRSDGAAGPRVTLHGQPLALPARATQPIAMAVHELATNALKYGALSNPQGRLDITWHRTEKPRPMLHLRWAETGGPAPDGPPDRHGFGTRVLRGTLENQLGGTVALDWLPGGLVCTIVLPLSA